MSWSSQIAVLYRALLNQFISFTQRPLSKLALLAWCRAQIYCSARALTRSLKDCRLPLHASLLRLKNLQRHRLSRLVSCANLLFCASAGSPAAQLYRELSAFKGISLAYETRRQLLYQRISPSVRRQLYALHTQQFYCIPREFHLPGIPKNISQCSAVCTLYYTQEYLPVYVQLYARTILLYQRISPGISSAVYMPLQFLRKTTCILVASFFS